MDPMHTYRNLAKLRVTRLMVSMGWLICRLGRSRVRTRCRTESEQSDGARLANSEWQSRIQSDELAFLVIRLIVRGSRFPEIRNDKRISSDRSPQR